MYPRLHGEGGMWYHEDMTLLIKLSGGALGSETEKYSEDTLRAIANHIKELLSQGHRLSLVVGGGNLFRGRDLAGKLAVEQATADYIGMLATVQNALVLRDYFESCGIPTRVSSAISMPQICENYIPQKAQRHMDKGRVVIFAAGLGAPFFTTDSCAVQRALEIKADMLVMAKHGIDGVYSADPAKDPNATRYTQLTANEVLEQDLAVADASAIGLAKDHGLTIKVVDIARIQDSVKEDIGTMIVPQ